MTPPHTLHTPRTLHTPQPMNRSRARSRRTRLAEVIAAGAVALSSASPARAGLAQDDVVAPGGFVSAYSGLAGAGRPSAGDDHAPNFAPGELVLQESTFAGLSTASAASSYANPPYANQGSGTVGMGALAYAALADETSNLQLSGAVVNGGWTDGWRIDHAGLDGQAGFLSFALAVTGTLEAGGGPGGLAYLDVEIYRDQANQPTVIRWQLQSTQINPNVSLALDERVSVTVPFVFGQDFSLGVYAAARAGTSSEGSLPVSPDASLAVAMQWDGIDAIADAAHQPVAGAMLSAASGRDWTQPVSPVPAPPAAAMLALGLAVVAGRVRRRALSGA